MHSFIKIFAIEISVFLKNNCLKKTMLQISILWCWGIPIKCYRLV